MANCVIIRNNETNEVEKVFAPNGEESKLFKDLQKFVGEKEQALRLWAQVYTDSFKKWFGDWENGGTASKVVDKNGEPLIVYHGSDHYGFPSFNKEMLGNNTGAASARKGFFFASNKHASRKYVGSLIQRALREQLLYDYEYSMPDSDYSQLEADADRYFSEDTESQYEREQNKFEEAYRLNDAEKALEQGFITQEDLDALKEDYRKKYGYEDNLASIKDKMIISQLQDIIQFWEKDDYGRPIAPTTGDVITRASMDQIRKSVIKTLDKLSIEGEDLAKEAITEENQALDKLIYSLFLNIKNPFVYDYQGQKKRVAKYADIIQEALENGHDGVILTNTFDPTPTDIYVTFEPNQMKSVSNQGTFVTEDPRIQFNRSFFPTKEEQENEIGNTIAVALASKLSSNLNIPFKIVTPEQARAITKGTWKGEKAFYFKGQTYFLPDGMNMNNAIHEFAHPLVDAVSVQNPTLFNKLYTELIATPEGAAIVNEVKELYPEFSENDLGFKKEVLVRAMTKEAMNNTNDIKNSTGFLDFIKKLLFAFKQALRKVFGNKVKVEKLSTNTTLAELADMLKSDTFEIDTSLMSEEDFIQYSRERKELVESLNNVDSSNIAHVTARYYDLIQSQLNMISGSKNYAEAKKLLVNSKTGKSLLKEIGETLEASPEIDKTIQEFYDEIETRKKNALNLIASYERLDLTIEKVSEHMNELIKKGDTQDTLSSVFYYSLLVRNWDRFIQESNKIFFDNGLNPGSELGKLLSSIESRLDILNRQINKAYTPGVVKVLKETLAPLAEKIDLDFQAKIDKAQKDADAGNPNAKKLIEDLKKQWDETRLTEERIKDFLLGNLGDTNPLSPWLEDFTNNPSVIVGGFAVYIKNIYSDVDAEAQKRTNEFLMEMEPLLEDMGYSRTNFVAFAERIAFLDTVTYMDIETGEIKTKQVWTFLNEFKNVDVYLKKSVQDYDKAMEEGNQDEADRILAERRQHLKDYFHQQYNDEFYKRDEVYESLEKNLDLEDAVYGIMGVDKTKATPAQKAEAAEIYKRAANTAYRKKHMILNEIKQQDALNYKEEYYEEIAIQKDILWREYARVASLRDKDGNPKFGEDLLSAMIERKYRRVSNQFFEWIPIEGQFEFSLDRFEQSLIDSGITPTGATAVEFKAKRDKWIRDNTVIKYTDDFYKDRNEVLDKLKAALAKVPMQVRQDIDSTAEIEEMLDLCTGFRDGDGQVMGDDLSEKSANRIKELQEAIINKRNKYAGYSGLTKEQMEELGQILDKRQAGVPLTTDEKLRLSELIAIKNELGIDKALQAEIHGLYRKLADIQSKEATDYYVDIMNFWLSQMGEPEVDNQTASRISSDPKEYVRLFNKNKDFEKWFRQNHILKEVYDKDEDANIMVYERLFHWSRTRPNDPKYFEKTTLANGEVIMGKPKLSYFYRSVKDSYTDASGNKVQIRTPKIVGKTVDNKGNWLPKTLDEGAKADSPYINKEYYELKKNDPKAFKALEKMKEFHIKWQDDMARESRLYMQAPRYMSMAVENARNFKKKGLSEAKKLQLNIKKTFFQANDDYSQDIGNFNPANLVNTDMFNEEVKRIPVTGLYNLEPEEVSLNFLDSMVRYMESGLKQKKLIESNPFAQALKAVVEDPDNGIARAGKYVKSIYIKQGKKVPVRDKGLSNTAKAVGNLYEREFLGVNIADWSKDYPGLWKAANVMSKIGSIGMFALNIPSAIKNRQGAIIQALVEASGGEWMSMSSFHRGKIRAFRMMKENSTQLYRNGVRSLDVQMMQIWNPGEEFFDKSVKQQFGRSLANDVANLSFLMSPRKFLEFEATVEMMCGMLCHIQVEQRIGNDTKKIDYIDAFELVNGQIQLKPGIDPDYGQLKVVHTVLANETADAIAKKYNITVEQLLERAGVKDASEIKEGMEIKVGNSRKFNATKNRVHEVSKRLQGAYSKMSRSELDRTFIGHATKYLKKYFVAMFMNWFAAERPSAALGAVTAGNYTHVIKLLRKMHRYGIKYWMWMDPKEAAALRKVATQAAAVFLMHMFLDYALGYDPEDKERLKKMKLREKKGMLSKGWAQNQAIAIMLATSTETETWLNPRIFKNTFAGLQEPVGIMSIGLETPFNIIDHSIGAIFKTDEDFYKKEVGPYWFQKDKQPKIYNDIFKIFGITGSFVSGAKATKSQEDIRKGLFN